MFIISMSISSGNLAQSLFLNKRLIWKVEEPYTIDCPVGHSSTFQISIIYLINVQRFLSDNGKFVGKYLRPFGIEFDSNWKRCADALVNRYYLKV